MLLITPLTVLLIGIQLDMLTILSACIAIVLALAVTPTLALLMSTYGRAGWHRRVGIGWRTSEAPSSSSPD